MDTGMSYTLKFYSVMISELEAASRGQGHPQLFERIRLKHQRTLDAAPLAGPNLGQVMREVLGGGTVQGPRSLSVYAMELLCDCLGQRVDSNVLAEMNLAFVAEVLGVPSVEPTAEQAFLSGRSPVSIVSDSGTPVIGFVTAEELRAMLACWSDDAIEHTGAEVMAVRYDVRGALMAARQAAIDLVSFLY